MSRIFYCDYGGDTGRLARMEAVFADLRAAGADVCRTSRGPLDSVARTLPMPRMLTKSPSKQGLSAKLPGDPLLAHCAAIYRYDHPGRSVKDCLLTMQLYRLYIEAELQEFAPDLAVLWHQFNPYSYLVSDWCARNSVPVVYGEHGVLPGSWCFERGGQMGESWISRDPAAFRALPVRRDDIDRAEIYLKRTVAQRLNRKTDSLPLAEAGDLAATLAADPRPKILYAGVNDFKAGLQPFSRGRTLLHTGDFTSSEAGLAALLPLARRNGWHILFKPHPSIKHDSDGLAAHAEYLTVIDRRVDLVDLIGLSDALATIVSQSAYMSLMHGTPTVLMGRIQLSGSGLVQEAPYRDGLEAAVQTALAEAGNESVRAARQAELVEHVARLLRYYVIAAEHGQKGLFPHDLSDLAGALLKMTSDKTANTP